MRITTITATGFKVVFTPKTAPKTSALSNLLSGQQVSLAQPSTSHSNATVSFKKATDATLQTSGKARFAKRLSYEEEVGGRFCARNGGRKPRTFSRATIRGMFIN